MSNESTAKNETKGIPDLAGADFMAFASEEVQDRRIFRASLWGAIGLHAVLLLANYPTLGSRPRAAEEKPKKYFVVTTPRFQLPPEPPAKLPQRLSRRVPVPDPDPQAPEPLRLDEPRLEVELPVPDLGLLPIPDAPPPEEPSGPRPVTGEVEKPLKVHAPQPGYTEAARRARIEGLVTVQAIIDRQGNVTAVRVLKGLPMGLSEETVKTVKKWKFRPATLGGKPVDVYYNLSVNFRLQ